MSSKVIGIIALASFAGAAGVCVMLSATYPIAIWSAGYLVISRRKLHAQQTPMCPLMQHAREVAATKQREVRVHVVD